MFFSQRADKSMKTSQFRMIGLIVVVSLFVLPGGGQSEGAQNNLGYPKKITGKDGAPMVLVSAGKFIMGSNDGDGDVKPRRRVYLDGYYIDKYLVTNARFRSSGMRSEQDYGSKFNGANQPVVGVTWFQARDYCRNVGKRLPTEAEWEKAARGTDVWKYPWGNRWEPDKLIWTKNSGTTTHPVDRAYNTHKSPYGAVDMAGNVYQWVNDWYSKDYYSRAPARNPRGPSSGEYRSLRGGSWWSDSAVFFRAAFRLRSSSGDWSNFWGFRCAKALK
jgi:formylglycine-generating enzyme required for sulfatase activity